MSRLHNDTPPRWVLAFFRWFCHPRMRESIEGDLLELYHYRKSAHGLSKAKWLLIKDVLHLFRPAIIGNRLGIESFSIMKNIKWVRLILLSLLVVACILSPFAPGPSNKIVLGLSVAAQTLGYLGLALAPLGAGWTIIQARRFTIAAFTEAHQKQNDRIAISVTLLVAFIFLCFAIALPQPMPKTSFTIALILLLLGLAISWRHGAEVIVAVSCLSTLLFPIALLTLIVFVATGIWQGVLALLLVGGGIAWLIRQIMRMKKNESPIFRQLPVHLIVIPIVSLLASTLLMKPASEFSRNYAIERSKTLIDAIEQYKNAHGTYPDHLREMEVIQPNIMGIDKFRYEKVQDRYSLSFSQWLDWGSLEEIVLYDKSDLRNNFTEQELCIPCGYKCAVCRSRTAFASYNTKYPYWQYYHCD